MFSVNIGIPRLFILKQVSRRAFIFKFRFFSSFFALNKEKDKYLKEPLSDIDKKVFSEIEALEFSDLKGQKPRKTQLNISYPTDFLYKHPVFDEKPELQRTKNDTLDSSELLKESYSTDVSLYIPEISKTDALRSNENDIEYLSMITGIPSMEIKNFKQRTLVVRRVVNQTRKGKIPSMYALVIVGNENGMIGMGEGKGRTLRLAAKKAYSRAVKNMQYIPRYEDRTIYGNVAYKFHAVHLELRSRPYGFGLRANHYVHEICRYVGIKDISAKVRGSRTGMNVVKATFEALKTQVLPQDIARARGKKVVDVIHTYYS
ncbi:mitochondrial 37S ribosomal protein MRPS5 [Pneumocystis jirovecii RU7]|uniref:Small ribosomal subunit protein uS5m n=1 Tax=Pneumocystis jirovecii (strain RU7) TaxID=1408657 RepID=A0A0W4ZGK7_PNEJ7|nr:mitochondrial 37S ribosomal protein MRPS5 [Pneumocystis jirovecii RU7]KTW27511.1 hypothetical protein T551_03010 [Pneumocystis jirovecii RU7]